MNNIVHVDLRFDAGYEPNQSELSKLTDNIIELLEKQFPNYSGSCMLVQLEEEDGEESYLKQFANLKNVL